MTDDEKSLRTASVVQALCVLKIYPLSPAVLNVILGYGVLDINYLKTTRLLICELFDIDEVQLLNECRAISEFMMNNGADLQKELLEKLMKENKILSVKELQKGFVEKIIQEVKKSET